MKIENKSKFKVKNVVDIKDVISGKIDVLPESDLCIQEHGHIIQWEYVPEETKKREKTKIKPGVYNILQTRRGIVLDEFEVKELNLLDSIVNTKEITDESDFFFNRLDVYDELELEKKRAVLLHGSPGMGKTAAITKIVHKLTKEDPGTVVLNWYSQDVDSSSVLDFLSSGSEFTKECNRLIIIIEDIGSTHEAQNIGAKTVDRAMLNLLDGVGMVYKIPTFFIATTNYAENLPENLANRPGRFDKMIEVKAPNAKDRLKLAKFIAKRDLTKEEESVILGKEAEGFSIAHIKEIIVRAKLNEKPLSQVISELNEHAKAFNKQFKDYNAMGLGL